MILRTLKNHQVAEGIYVNVAEMKEFGGFDRFSDSNLLNHQKDSLIRSFFCYIDRVHARFAK